MRPTFTSAPAIGLLAFMFLLAGGAALRESAALDEIAHIGAAVSYVQKLDLRMNQEHPPLAKVIAGIPLAIRGTRADYSSPLWRESESVFSAYLMQWAFGDCVQARWNDWRSTLAWARLPMLLLTLWLGWTVYSYATRLTDLPGGLLCLAIYCVTPAFLVFGPLVLTDIPVTLFSLIAMWQLGEIWSNPSRRATVLFAASFGAAMLSKFTGLILFAVVIALFAHTRFWPSSTEPADKPQRKLWRKLRWRAVWKGALWALLAVYLFYLVFSWNMPDTSLEKLGPNALWAHAIRRLLMPVWLYVRGILLMLALGSRPTFLLGHEYPHGEPFYFPVVFALKSPLGFLILLLLSAVLWIVLRRRGNVELINAATRPHWRVLMIGFGVFLSICLLSRLDISLRHFTIPMVFLILLLAPLPRMIRQVRGSRTLQLAATALVASCFAAVISAYPFLFSFVNSLGSGQPLYRLVNDSNVDWNQSLPEVRRYAESHRINPVKLDWIALSDPAQIIPNAQPWDCQAPASADAGQTVIVSAVAIVEERHCGWLERYPHESIGNGGMYAFHLPDPIPAPGTLGGPPIAADRKIFFGTPFDLRGVTVQLERHPENAAAVMKEIAKNYQPPSSSTKH